MANTVCHLDDIRSSPKSSGWHNVFWTLSHPDELDISSISSGWLMDAAVCHPDDLRYCPFSSGWHNVIWTLSHPDELAPGRILSGWLLDTAVCHADDISYHRMSSGGLSRNWYLIPRSYDNVIMSSGWRRLPFLNHPDEIANFDFPHHAVVLQPLEIQCLIRCWKSPHFRIIWTMLFSNIYYIFLCFHIFTKNKYR